MKAPTRVIQTGRNAATTPNHDPFSGYDLDALGVSTAGGALFGAGFGGIRSIPLMRDIEPAVPPPPQMLDDLSAANTTGVLVEGAGTGTCAFNFRLNAADPNWGLSKAHLDKHLLGSGPTSLRQVDPAGNPDLWRNYMQELAGRPATATLKAGIQDVIGTLARADGGGSFRFGIRIAPGVDDTWDVVTLLTKH